MGQSFAFCLCVSTKESIVKLFITVAKTVTEVAPFRCCCHQHDNINSYSWNIADYSSDKPFDIIDDSEMWSPCSAVQPARNATEQELSKFSLTFLIDRGRWGVGSRWSICLWPPKFKIWLVTNDVRCIYGSITGPEMTVSVANQSTSSYHVWATTHCLSLFGQAILHSRNSQPSAPSFVQPSSSPQSMLFLSTSAVSGTDCHTNIPATALRRLAWTVIRFY